MKHAVEEWGESVGEARIRTAVLFDVRAAEGLLSKVADKLAHLTVRFVSQMITATRDKDGAVIDGNPEKLTDVTDVWTFSRDVSSRDPNWKLVGTESGH